MTSRAPLLLALAATLALGGCSTKTAATPVTPGPSPAVVGTTALGTATLTGTVLAPATLVPASAGSLVASGAGNLVASGAGNLVASGAGNLALLALAEKKVAKAQIFVFDSAGALVTKTTTDAEGRYAVAVPPGQTYKVMAGMTQNNKVTPLVALGVPGKESKLSTSSTCVAQEILMLGLSSLKGVDPNELFDLMSPVVDEITSKLGDDLPDLSSQAAVARWSVYHFPKIAARVRNYFLKHPAAAIALKASLVPQFASGALVIPAGMRAADLEAMVGGPETTLVTSNEDAAGTDESASAAAK